MDRDDFLEKCRTVGVSEITDAGNDYDEGFKVIFKDGSAVYVLFRNEYGDAWMEYETGEHFNERWKNTKILSAEETREFSKRIIESIKDKYSDKNFTMFTENLFTENPDKELLK